MNAITLWQPHASLIIDGPKRIETRTHDRFRGLVGKRIAIHAAARKVGYIEAAAMQDFLVELGCASPAQTPAWLQRLPLGALLGTVRVARFGILKQESHAKAACSDIDDNRFGLFLEDVRKLDRPIPWKGERGIFAVPNDVIPESAR